MKNVKVIFAGNHIQNVVEPQYAEESLKVWKDIYEDAEVKNLSDLVNEKADMVAQITEVLNLMECFYDTWMDDENTFVISIQNGDWKHDHQAVDYVMETAFGIACDKVVDTDIADDGDDSYSADHYYKLKEAIA